MRKKFLLVLTLLILALGGGGKLFAENGNVAKVGNTEYATIDQALAATKTMTGDVTVEIYDKVTFNQPLIGDYTSINFVGKDTDAEMYLYVQGYTTATGKKVSFTDLKLSKSEGGFITNAGFMNVAFGIFDVAEVSYTNCTFLNGAYASSGKVTYTGCTFKKSWDKYGLWAYGNVDITVDGCTFADYRGIKMYAENGANASVEKPNLVVKNTNFSAVNNKPAIVLTYGESVVLEGNTYSSTGVFELDLNGKPNGVAVASDVAPTCINDNGACGVLVDGKIYTTVAQAAEVATNGSTVKLLHNSTETVKFPMGVTLEKNGFDADGVTVVVPVAQIGEVKYETFQAALKAIGSGDVVINLLKDVTMDITAWQTLAIGAENTTSITIDGENGDNDFTLTFNKLNSDWNHIATSNDNATKLILKNLKLADSGKNNGPWNRYDHNFACDVELTNVVSNKALAFKAGATLYNVTINESGDNYAIWIQPNGQDVDINGLTVVSAGRGIKIDNQYVGDAQLVNLSVTNAKFETVKKAAIVVKSPAGANIVAENVDITKVAADSRNLVWVDEDGATDFGKVTLTGGTVAQEGLEGFVAAISANDKVQAYYTSLQAAIDAVQNGETIVLTKDCDEDVSINKSNVAFTINGKISDTENIAYTGKIQINVGQNVTVKNINFSHAGDEAHDFIANVGSPTGKNYNTTLLVEGCSFVGGNNNYNTVAVRTIHPTHTQIKNSTGTGLHSFLQNTGGQQVTVEGVVLTDSKGGLAISSPNGAVSVKGCDLTTNTYGVRLDANNTNAPGATLENNKVNAYIPVSVRKATAPNYNLTFNGEENAYVATNGDNVWCAVCTTEYEEGVALNAPTGKVRVTLNGAGLNADGIYGNSINFEGLGTEESPYLINNLNDLKFFRNNVNAGNKYSGKYVKLTADIDLNNENWTPIGTSSNPFNGTFDGKNHTISNLVINGGSNSDQGFFGRTNDGEIKNVTFNNAKVTGRLNVGVVAGQPYTSKYTNVKVTGHVEVNGMAYVGGVGGKNAYANWTDITVDVDETSYVKANSVENGTAYRTYVGGVVGFNGEGGHTFKNISSNIKVIGSTMDIGGIFGIAHYSNKFENIRFTGSVEAPEGAKEVGGIAGVWHNEKGTSVTFTNCTSTGTVKVGDVTTTGSIVGAAYNPDNKYEENSGSLIIDGEEAWLPRKVATKAELDAALAAAQDGDIIVMTADIDYGTSYTTINKAITLDLGGKILTTSMSHGSIRLNGGCTLKNGTLNHNGGVAALKVWDAAAIENLVINVAYRQGSTIGGIVIQENAKGVASIKNVTIQGEGLTNGIETYNCGNATENVIGAMENVTIDAQGTGMLISAPCGTATNCSISGGTNGIEIWIKGNYSASLDLVASKVEGGVYAHDEFINNPDAVNNGKLSLTADNATTGAGLEDVTLTIARAEAENVKGVLKDVMEAAQAKIGDTYYTTIEKAFKAAQAGQTVTILKAGTYPVPSGKDLTITGDVDGVVFANIGAHNMGGANVTFNNVTFTYADNSTYKGLQHSGNLVYNNCTFNGQVFLYGASETFNNCTFNTTDSNNYNVWTYGAKEVAFNECTFNCAGKSVLIYNESASVNNKVAVTNSQFNASQAVEGKAAIEMDSSLQGTINLTIDGETTATGFAAGNVSGNSLWNNKKDNNDITVVVNNETVLAPINGDGTEDNPYLINNVRELVAFRKSVNAGKTEFNAPGVYVALNADIDLDNEEWTVGIGDGHNYSFDGNFDGKNYTIKNLNIKPYADADNYICGGLFGYTFGSVTIKNLVIENAKVNFATAEAGKEYHNVGVLVGFANNKDGKLNIDNVIVKGDIKVDAPQTYGVGAIVGYSYRDMGTISNCTVDANEGSYIKGYSFVGGITGYSYSNAVISNCSVENLAITATSKGVGGIAGLALEGNNISGCTVANTTTVNGETNVAYIIGELGNSNGNVIIENCTAPQPWVGGAYATGEPFVATIGTKYYTSIKDAIKAVKDNETIVLIRDITMDYNARDSYETQTQNIVIDGNDHTLTLNQKNSDWASIGLANNSKLVLNNMTIEKTGYGDTSGAWNTHAIIFSCPLEMNDVIVNNSMAVQAGAILNNVAIKEANGYYGLWINGNGQSVTMNGGSITATNGGRGIKIADQYIDAPAQVTLNVTGTVFNTAKKAAVLVSSKEGAQIVASNVNIENVAEDTVNFVWVDEDWAANFGNVEVTGAKVAQEGIEKFVAAITKGANVEGYYKTLLAAVNAVQNGETIGGTVTLIKDVAENVTVSQAPNVAITIDGNNKTFKGTITVDGKSAAYATAGLTIKNVNFDATNISKDACINLGGNNSIRYTSNVTVEYCTFTGTDKAKVGVKNYTGGCKNVTIKNCTATGLHSLAQLKTSTTVTLAENTVTESKNGVSLGSSTGVTVTECTFTVDGYGIRPDGGASVTITDSNISAFIPVVVRNASADASLTFNGTNDMTETNTDGYWCVIGTSEYEANGELPTPATGKVVVDLIESNLTYEGVYGNYAVAKIDKVQYASLQAAIEDAQNGETVILFANTDEVVSVNVLNKEISIVGEEGLFPVLTGGLDFGIDNHSQDAGNITIKGIKFVGNGIKIDDMASVTIEGNIFENITASNAIYVAADEYTTTLAITNNIITNVAGAGINLRNPINATVTGNTITNVTGNAMTFQNNGAIEDVAGKIVITGNVLTDWANGKTEGRAIRLALGNIADNVIIEENAMIAANAPEEFVKISGTSNAEISVDENYWYGVAPTAQHFLADGVQIHNYYALYDEANGLQNLVTIAGETFEIFYTAAGVETTKEQAAYSLSFTVTDYENNEVSVKIGKKPTKQATLNLPTTVEFNGIEYTITLIPVNAFHTCYHFVGDLVIPAKVKRIENGAFQQCFADSGEKLGTLTLNENLTYIGNAAFLSSRFKGDLVVPSSVEYVGNYAFNNSGMDGTLTINCNVTNRDGFNGSKFTKLVVSEGVTSVGFYRAFAGMKSLKEVTLPSTLEEIGNEAFYEATAINKVYSSAFEAPAINNNNAFDNVVKDNATLCVKNYKNYQNGEWAEFDNVYGEFVIQKEGYSLLVKVNDDNCSVQIKDTPKDSEKRKLEIPAEFDYFGTTKKITSIAADGFKSCNFYGEVVVPGTIKTVGNNAFNSCYKINRIVFENGVESIGRSTLGNMYALTYVEFPASLKTIGDNCFTGYGANHKIITIVSYATEVPVAETASSFQQYVADKATLYVFEDVVSKYKNATGWSRFKTIKPIEAKIGETVYYSLAKAIEASKAGDVITLIADVKTNDANPISIQEGVTLDINTHDITANIYGTVKTDGGLWTTVAVPGFNSRDMLGEGAIYNTIDATVVNLANEVNVLAGTIVLNPHPETEWWTLPGQSLSIATGAKFEIPAGVKFTVRENTHVVVEGTLVTDGTVNLQAGATVRAEDGLNIKTTVPGHVVKYNNGVYSVVEQTIFTQTIQLKAGWNWFSSYVETDLESLQEALGTSGVQIKDRENSTNYYPDYNTWYGELESIVANNMYMIKTIEDVTISITGNIVNAENITITLNPGWNWIASPISQAMDINVALQNLEATDGDQIKNRVIHANYYGSNDVWYGDLNTIEPGIGYMYFNNSNSVKTFKYVIARSEAKANITTDGNYWIPNAAQFANNMTMTAVLDVENINYEVAAFVNGECRGSARPIYVEPLDAYMLFLTIHGDEVEEMTFKYYDIDTDTEYTLSDRINYSNNAILGSLKEPYMFTRGTTGIGEAELSQLNIYPNPTTTAAEINLNATFDKVEVFNALGVKVAEYSNVDSIDALETAGIYVIRATNNSVISHCRLVVK